MSQRHDIPAVVLGTCINGLAVARALGRNGVPVVAVTRDASSPGVHSRFVRGLWRYDGGEDALVDLLLRRGGEFAQRPALFPITDRVVLAVAARREELARSYRLPLPEEELVRSAMGKRGFVSWAEKLGLPVPRTEFVSTLDEADAAAGRMSYPCVAKPDFQTPAGAQAARLKVCRAEGPAELVEFYRRIAPVEPSVVIQEWIPGGDGDVYFCLMYLDRGSRPLASFVGRKIRQWPPLSGTGCSLEPVVYGEMEDLARRFFTGIGYRGLGSLECKRGPEGSLRLVEATIGRTDFNGGIADANGAAIAYAAYRDLAGLDPLPPRRRKRPVRWVRWSADRAAAAHYRRAGELGLLDWLWSIRPPVSWSTWAADDPLPYLAGLGARLRMRVGRLGRRLVPTRKGAGSP